MRMRRCLILASFLFICELPPAGAGEIVDHDVSSSRDEPLRLLGYLTRPADRGPFPAVVVLHGCAGFDGHVVAWADRLRGMGYAALALDSLGSRRLRQACAGGAFDQSGDAYRALDWLAKRPFVRADRVALLGFSMGGTATLLALERDTVASRSGAKFRAGLAFYPSCSGASGIFAVPSLILIGELDDWTPAAACREMIAGRSGTGVTRKPGDRSTVDLVLYPGAQHGFDIPALQPMAGVELLGHRLAYDEAATIDATRRLREILQLMSGK